MTNRVADDFAAIRRRMEELTQHELVKQTDTGDEHTIAVQPSTGKRYKWINGSWTEESYEIPAALQGRVPETYSGYEINWDAQEDLGSIDHEPTKYWRILEAGQPLSERIGIAVIPQASIDCSVTSFSDENGNPITYEEWVKQGHTLLDCMI